MLMTSDNIRHETTHHVCHTRRPQSHRFIHKALRALMFRTLQQVASLDAGDAGERATLVAQVEELLQVCTDHLVHENTHFHAPMRERAPRAVAPFDADHEEHLSSIARLRQLLSVVAQGSPAARDNAYELYLELSRFVGENLEHMADEETAFTHALWEQFSDADIEAMDQRLQATFTPQEGAYYLRWMARGLNHAELQELVGKAMVAMPTPVFQGLCGLLQEELPAERWRRLACALTIAPMPGLKSA
ncbi:hemerythrin domain-containing protein [Hydrogenophaga sp.]|uniref:hemerythrin domain-containing protein n=1 Tax=Hydrogenophaga sp. TaxID=1904254 RepID=UPI00356714E6